ncbi:MAG: VWA domain-containing protein [Acidobacteriota bacterium]|nr:VWA domain-containing protein [Acidobacteriota bacterium]
MKKFAALVCSAIICFGFTFDFAQSRRVPPSTDNNGKVNKRAPQPETSPTPQSASTPQPEITNEQNANEQTAEADSEVLKIDTELVSIPVKISDRKGRFVAGLTKENFQVFEDNVPQEIAYFTNEEQPFTVALVLDMSYSSTFKIAEIQAAAISFIAQLREKDRVMVVSFDGEVHLLTEPTGDRQILQRAIRGTKISPTGTSLYEAVDLVINQRLKKITGRKAIVLFTDGVDTTSRRANDLNNLGDALELDALVYPIRYDTFADVQAMKNKSVILPPTTQKSPIPSGNPFPFPLPVPVNTGGGTPGTAGTTAEDYKKAEEYLNEMANRTGGRVYQASDAGNLALAFSNIAGELREYYSLGYYPKDNSKSGRIRRIKVRVNRDGAVVRARDSYVIKKVKTKN